MMIYFGIMQKGFLVPEDRREWVLGRASIRWRTFKARLRRDWMYSSNEKDKSVIMKKPPELYPWILQTDWDKFIETYTDPKFKVIFSVSFTIFFKYL